MHRNIKPACVLLGRDGTAFLGDFGLAVRGDARDGHVCGSLRYMDPRLFARDAAPDRAADVYAYAMLLYELFAEQVPHARFDDRTTTPRHFVRALRRHRQELLAALVDRMAVPGLAGTASSAHARVLAQLRALVARACGLAGAAPVDSSELPGLVADCAFGLFALPPHLLARYRAITGNVFLSRISTDDFVRATDRALGTPETSAGSSEYAALLRRTLLRDCGALLSIRDVQNIARWLPHDDDLVLLDGKNWFLGDVDDCAARDILAQQGARAFVVTVERDPLIREPFVLILTLGDGGDEGAKLPLSSKARKTLVRSGHVATARVADIAQLLAETSALEEHGFVAPTTSL